MMRISDCFDKGLLRQVDPSDSKAGASLAQAREWVDEAKRDLGIGAVRSALMAVYMGYFHAARVVLFRDGVREKACYVALRYSRS